MLYFFKSRKFSTVCFFPIALTAKSEINLRPHTGIFDMSPLAILLREIRVGLGLSQVNFASALSLKGPYISEVETGKRYAPLLENIAPNLENLGMTGTQVKRLYTAERMSPRQVKIPPTASQEVFICAATLQEYMDWLEQDDFIKLTVFLHSLASKRSQQEAPNN